MTDCSLDSMAGEKAVALDRLTAEAPAEAKRLGRILVTTSNFPRWQDDSTTPFILHLAQDLQALGWQVDVLAPHAPGVQLRETLRGVRVFRFRYAWPAAWQTLCYRGGALANLRKSPSSALRLPGFLLAEWLATTSRLLRGRYDFVHSHWLLPQGFTAALAAGLTGVPHVATIHGSDVFALGGRTLALFKRFALRQAAAVTANSSATMLAASEIGGTLPLLKKIPMGVCEDTPTPEAVSELRRRYRRGDGPCLMFAGRLVQEKGIADLIRAVALACPRLPDITAAILGEGPERPTLERLAQELGVAERIVFAGWVDPERIASHLAAADIFVGPSWSEGQGLVVAEALRAGTAVVATGVGGVVDVIHHERTGLLVPTNAPADIADAVERLAREPDLATRLTSAGAELVARDFTRSASAQAFSELFRSLLPTKDHGA
jgi:glycosyltransferase involved in cell wall biosynthesis